ncbi:bifunctional aspartate transaminase/aspartate 4-decarboxylase [Cloacibacillus evryensis]|uniref:Bifunctional aspartate transaminase/aspartate 4-decarboxylase n=1 Tax=Cloacibacillus evryensis TaxID=508460 RepID=A0AAW5K5T7_9BACT|nr:bifunctional aspartate transaminase/aspartate 4-decarboxylase [Cloacibacillus evryensis]EHL69791.1 aspartate 4-decarboxylase [Synergistes sp. 3_1_syn1]MCQ4815116.1 bifunctional aspartate transaminase/aspartate 4-decarboxylase [Cloacibacillus evryensis]
MDMPTKKQEKAYETLSPFEVKNVLIEMASKHARAVSSVMLNAGRGNPNWIATEPREAFFTLGRFAITESRRVWDEGILAGLPEKEGMGSRLAGWLDVNSMMPGADCLKRSFQYGVNILGFDADEWAYELCDGILGCHYPTPDRIMPCCESAVREYIIKELEQGGAQDQDFDLFATEGATAAMVYIFRSLLNNGLLKPGDTIALGTPIFTPYIEIPNLPWYSFKTVQVYADGTELVGGEPRHSWQYSDRELEKLADRQVKVFFIVNPSNPGSVEISPETAQKIKNIVTAKNPQLMIVTDDVYSSFADDYRSLFDTIPYNTICSYSFSKYFGCTGWRLGVIGIHRKNVFDDMIAAMPAAQRIKTAKLYAELAVDPEKIKFIDRMVADSRDIALNHTAGLSVPQQVQMALFAIHSLIDKTNAYNRLTKDIIRRRCKDFWNNLKWPLPLSPHSTAYYQLLDISLWAKEKYGEDFAEWLMKNFEPIDILFRLAENPNVVLLPGEGFDAPDWSVRVSLANLPDHAYREIGRDLVTILDEYYSQYKKA